jgi:hypothetical protein
VRQGGTKGSYGMTQGDTKGSYGMTQGDTKGSYGMTRRNNKMTSTLRNEGRKKFILRPSFLIQKDRSRPVSTFLQISS